MNLRAFLSVLAAAAALGASAPTAPAAPIRSVRVEQAGPAAVDEGSVRAVLHVREGQAFDPITVMQDVKALEKTGRYSSVDVRRDFNLGGVDLLFVVRARARISQIDVEGADGLGNKKVAELMGIHVGDLVDEAVLAAGAAKAQSEYLKKYFPHARLTWQVDEDAQTGRAKVRIEAKEGPRARIRRVDFSGNASFDSDLLRKKMKQRRYRWYNPVHWFKGTGRLDDDELAEDVYSLARVYEDSGYLDVKIGEPEIAIVGPSRIVVHVPVVEGRLYRIGTIGFQGVTKFTEAEVSRGALALLKTDAVASRKAIDDAADAALDYYGNRGYIRTGVDPRIDADAKTGVANLSFVVKEGTLSTIRDIRIRGNAITQDRVIRREITVFPGEKFNRSRVKTSERRLLNLGYFANVQSQPESTPEADKHDLVFEVEEQRMGQASAGVGFSSIDELSGYFEIGHGNVDVTEWPPLGGGQKVRLRVVAGTKRKDIELSFVEPYLFDQRLSLGVDLYRREMSYLSREFDQRITGGEVSLSKPINTYNRVSLAYGLDNIEIYNVDEDASEAIRAEEGTRLKSAITLALTHDTRNLTFIPTRGNLSRIATTLAGGPLGGDTDWYRFEARTSQYFQPFQRFGLSHVFMLRGQAGTMEEYGDSDRVPIFDRFFLGGVNTIRAFKYREVGPHDEDDEPLGGRSAAFASAEYTVPIYREKEAGAVFQGLRFATFVDGGMVWADPYDFDMEWNSGYGIGIRLDIPFMPLRLDYAWPIKADGWNEDSNGRFNFMIGYGF